MSVYFALVGDHIKIGHSDNPERRVRRLFSSATRYGAPAETSTALADRVTLRVIPGDLGDERAVHEALRDFAVGNEWFANEPEVREYIADLTPGNYPRLPRPDGPMPHYDEARDLSADELQQLREAMTSMFAASP